MKFIHSINKSLENMLRESRLGAKQLSKVIRLMCLKGSIEYSLNRARDYVDDAIVEIQELPQSLDVSILRQVAEYVLSRNH